MKMKKVGIICLTILLLSFKVNAQILHGINIDEIYNKSDWNSKGEIVEIVEDYGLMLNYQKDLENILNLRRATVSGVLQTRHKGCQISGHSFLEKSL